MCSDPSYLFNDLGGNSNSPTEMVSTALREILTTCWHSRLMKSYLHTSSDLRAHKPRMLNSLGTGRRKAKASPKMVGERLPVSDEHEPLPLIVPVVNSATMDRRMRQNEGRYRVVMFHVWLDSHTNSNVRSCLLASFLWNSPNVCLKAAKSQ